MGIFDGKDGGIFGDSSKKESEQRRGPADFSDTSAGASNTSSPAPSADFSDVTSGESSSAPAASTGGTTYTVKSGDSLSKIAKRVYGDASAWNRIYDANRDKIKDPDLIHPGQEFTIPDA